MPLYYATLDDLCGFLEEYFAIIIDESKKSELEKLFDKHFERAAG